MLIGTVGGLLDRVAGIDATHIHAWAEGQQAEHPRGMWIRYRLDRMAEHGAPDLTDPATVGCLLALVRASFDHVIFYEEPGRFWWVQAFNGPREARRFVGRWGDDCTASFVEALVCALEAAGSKP
jgi:hypothetical protein